MNTSWYTDYLNSESWDDLKFQKLGLNDSEIFFSWWITGDIQGDGISANEVLDIIRKAKTGISGVFLGNTYSAKFYETKAHIIKDRTQKKHEYPINDVEQALIKWIHAINIK